MQNINVTAEPTFLGWVVWTLRGSGQKGALSTWDLHTPALGWAWCMFQDVSLPTETLGAVSLSPAQSCETIHPRSWRSMQGAGAIPTGCSTPKLIPAEDWSPGGRCLPATCPSPRPMTHLGSTEPSAGPSRVRVDGIPHMVGQHHLLGVRPELQCCQRLRSWWDPGFRRGPLFSASGLGVGSAQPLPC